jgi:molybdate transport system ATP-binding protein
MICVPYRTKREEFGLTTIMVSHDPNEIYRLADRVVVFEKGKIIKEGIPRDVLLKTSGSQKFSFEGELLEIRKMDAIYVAVIAIGQQLVEVVISKYEAQNLKIGQSVRVSTKAFMPLVSS